MKSDLLVCVKLFTKELQRKKAYEERKPLSQEFDAPGEPIQLSLGTPPLRTLSKSIGRTANR